MFKTRILLGLVGLAMLALAGCATLVGGGPTQEINISSAPEGAKIWTGKLKGKKVIELVDTGLTTPSNITIRRTGVVVVLKKEGYKDTNVVLTRNVNGWFFGNIIIGGLLGSSIDLSTGASQKFDPSNFFVDMIAESSEETLPSDQSSESDSISGDTEEE